MSNKGLKTFRVQRRFEVWVEMPVKADSFERALEIGKATKLEDFIDNDKTEWNDVTTLPGLSVGEEWT